VGRASTPEGLHRRATARGVDLLAITGRDTRSRSNGRDTWNRFLREMLQGAASGQQNLVVRPAVSYAAGTRPIIRDAALP
jgi:hypothetical protein